MYLSSRVLQTGHQVLFRTIPCCNSLAGGGMDDEKNSNSFESSDDFERRIFNETSGGSFFTKLDRLGKAHDGHGSDLGGGIGSGSGSHILDGLDESFNTLSDGMDGKLEKAATYFEFDEEEVDKDDYSFRPDMTFKPGMTYETKDLDLTKPGVRKLPRRYEFEVTTKEVLRKADFRHSRKVDVKCSAPSCLDVIVTLPPATRYCSNVCLHIIMKL
ncbi:hypothetical protein D8674_023131 [Pyrus ussuriensis x Pyrus communis]|uniref:Uncharacterized protein n=1 Tax=Pyrus ussuriensis x Pyrus communis TaxID=2448454 RepID=A0A5N5GP64_9ROSA|nr:hypothetical protein D8674_023131 [Pyrus ussuriensis x Pyrus communis]